MWPKSNQMPPYPYWVSISQKKKLWSKTTVIVTILIAVVFLISIFAVYAFLIPTNYERSYYWYYEGGRSLDLNIPINDYSRFQNSSHSFQFYEISGYANYVTETDVSVESLADKLEYMAISDGYMEYEVESLVLSFVQSLQYTIDSETTGHEEYPRYPVETLVDMGGDCEDTAILFASILEASSLGFDAILIYMPGHMAAGVETDTPSADAIHFEGKYYLYCETTSEGWEVGEIPSECQGLEFTPIQV